MEIVFQNMMTALSISSSNRITHNTQCQFNGEIHQTQLFLVKSTVLMALAEIKLKIVHSYKAVMTLRDRLDVEVDFAQLTRINAFRYSEA
jgi:hypothetical protein